MDLNSTAQLQGLNSAVAKQRLNQYGLNAIAEKSHNLWLAFGGKFWAPIPWMLEITIILQIIIGKTQEALVIFGLLIFNSLLSFFQEERANKALALLRQHLSISARVLRDAHWQTIKAEQLVPDDIVHLRMGDIAPADIRIIYGNILIDQSILTGESLPVEGKPSTTVYSGSAIKRGEATGKVLTTGSNTFYGKTAELVKTAEIQSHIKNIIFAIVKYLVSFNSIIAIGIFIFSLLTQQPLIEVIPFILILLVASIPAALPATFTLATAIGARHLTNKGVLIAKLSALEEAATMDVVCLDKTGTITMNQLTLVDLQYYQPYSKNDLLKFALLASDEATQDPIDLAIFSYVAAQKIQVALPSKLDFIPFDPANKRTEALFEDHDKKFHVVKGSPEIVAQMVKQSEVLLQDANKYAARGYRLIALAVNEPGTKNTEFNPVGLLALYDPPREDSRAQISNLKNLGLKVQMVTGDSLITAKAIAQAVGIGDNLCHQAILHNPTNEKIFNCDVLAGVFPEDKFNLVKALQQFGHTTGMTGDGVNDAPSLKQAEVGIAVANATDVAKASAAIILTTPGLSGIIAAVESSRRIHKRMLTYILNKITKSLEIGIFLGLGVFFTKTLIITPLLMVLLLFANDFVTMSVATDHVPFSPKPEKWKIPNLMLGAGFLAAQLLLLSLGVFFFGRNYLHLPLPELQTLAFLILVFTGQGTIYLVRERRHLWNSLPSIWVILSSLIGLTIVIIFATQGILMAALNPAIVFILLGAVALYLLLVDFIKVKVFTRYGII